MKKKEGAAYLCIGCPLGCDLKVVKTEGGWAVEGAGCRRGVEYALQEHLDPRRVLTIVVKVVNGTVPVVPARSAFPIPRDKLLEAARVACRTEVVAPVSAGQVLITDIAGAGVDLIATGKVPVSSS